MNILWITSAYPWHGHPYGGIFYQTQAQALCRLGVQVHVNVAMPWVPGIAALLSPRHALERSAPRQQLDEGVTVSRIPYLGHRYSHYIGRSYLALMRQVLRHLDFKPDLVHGHYACPMGLAAVGVARRLGVPSVITLHGSDVNDDPIKSGLAASRFRQAVTGADQLICVSRALGERTRELTGASPEYLPLGINIHRFNTALSREQARTELGLPQEQAIVLYIGYLHSSKGVPLAQQALAHPSLAGVLGLFVGEGPLGPSLAAQAQCRWQPTVQNSMIPKYLAAADLIILPSYSEGLPTVLVEAGACGTPIIATEVGGIPELLAEDRGRLIPAGSEEALRGAILEVLAHPETARNRAGRLRSYIIDTFDADHNAATLCQIYRRLQNQGGGPQV